MMAAGKFPEDIAMSRKCLAILFACALFCALPAWAEEEASPSFFDSVTTMLVDAVCELGGTLVPIGCEASSSDTEPEPPPAELGGTLVPIG